MNDNRSRLSSWTPGASPARYYNYDELGNLTGHGVSSPSEQNQVFNHPNRPHAISARLGPNRLYQYDDDGNLASVLSADPNRHFTFDSQNRLVGQGTSPGQADTLEIYYDDAGARVLEAYMSAGSPPYEIERFYFDRYLTLYTGGSNHWGELHIFAGGQEIALKRLQPLSLRTAALWVGPWGEIPVPTPPAVVALLAALLGLALCLLLAQSGLAETAQRQPVGALLAVGVGVLLVFPPLPARAGGGGAVSGRHWTLNDHLGSASVVLASDGLPEREVVYKPFGGVHAEAGSAGNSTVFAGHRYEGQTGLFYMQARWQDPETGTFVGVDPLVPSRSDPQSYNAYAYARNNPVTLVDPSGLFADEPLPPIPEIVVTGSRGGASSLSLADSLLITSNSPTLIDLVAANFVSGQAHVIWATVGYIAGGPLRPDPQSSQSGVAESPGSIVGRGFISILTDASALVVGNTYGKARVLYDDIRSVGSDLASKNWSGAARGIGALLTNLPFPNYGFFGGAGYGADQERQGEWHQPINGLDQNNRIHDYNFRHWQWLSSNYTRLPPGPAGAAYIAAGTPLFLLGSAYQWLQGGD